MKPFIIYIEENSTDIIMPKTEFEKQIEKAYNNGYEDGYNAGKAQSVQWWPTTDLTKVYYTNAPNTTSDPIPEWTKITCEAHNAIE